MASLLRSPPQLVLSQGQALSGRQDDEKVPFFSSRTAEAQNTEGPKDTRQPFSGGPSLCPLLTEAAVSRASATAQT